jgi:hypothetical protein
MDHFVRVLDAGAVAWVHPSWRDLVIDELAEDRVLRHAFLGAASIDGFLLALSLHGGGSGQRSLPLLVHDEDWDALADRLSELADDLDEPSMTRLFVGLVEALETIRDHRARELRAFAIYALQLAARIWDGRKARIPLGLLERWFDVRRRVGEPIEAPHLARTWVEALPLPEDVDLESATFHDDLRDWLGLVELLNDQEPGVLAELGFPQVAEPFVNIIASESGIVDPHVFLLLGRLADVLPAYDDAIRTMHRIRASAEVETYVPRELSAEMQDLLDAPPIAVQSGEATVRRVLRDL